MTTSCYLKESDNDLFLLVKKNDVTAFEELYHRYWSHLVNSAYKKLNSKEKAEDIVQNIFIDIYQRRSTINVTVSLKAYLNQALKFKVLNEYRSGIIGGRYLRHLFLNASCKTDLANPLEAKELELKVSKIVGELPDKCKEVFVLSRQENLTNREIAAKLNITVSTVEKHISKALKNLEERI